MVSLFAISGVENTTLATSHSVAPSKGTVPVEMSDRLAAALECARDVVDAVIAATANQRQDEAAAQKLAHERAYAASFRPYLRAEPASTVPEPIFPALMIGVERLLTVELADVAWDVSDNERERLVKLAIREHYDRCVAPYETPVKALAGLQWIVPRPASGGGSTGVPFVARGG